MAETMIDPYKTEKIPPKGPWRSIEDVEFSMASWFEWFDNRRLPGPIGNIPPVEYEEMYYRAQTTLSKGTTVN